MDKRSLIIGFILIPILVLAQNIDVYIVDNRDYKLIETKSVDQKDAGFDYSTIILVYDRYRDEIIGGCGSYKKGRPTTAKFREVINEVNNSDSIPMFYCYEKNPILAKYNVLGLS